MDNLCNCEKVVYPRKTDAQAAAAGIWDDDKIKMRPYKCPEGNGYHLTSVKSKTLRDIPHGLQSIIPLLTKNKSKKRK